MAKKVKEVTASEAITKLTTFFREFVMIGAPDGALGAAIKALEKQVAKKPNEVDRDRNYFECGTCGEAMYSTDDLESHHYCLNCGQAIEWGDPIEEALRNILDQEAERMRNK